MGEWGQFSQCSLKCGGGRQQRSRQVIEKATDGSSFPPVTEARQCNPQPCAAECKVGEWQPWAPCSKPCGSGTHTRQRVRLSGPTAACPALSESEPCNTKVC